MNRWKSSKQIIIKTLVNYAIITTIADSFLMGALYFHFSIKCRKKEGAITKANRIEFQNGYQCSAFSSAYFLSIGIWKSMAMPWGMAGLRFEIGGMADGGSFHENKD